MPFDVQPIHLLGHAVGAILYGLLLWLAAGAPRRDALPIATGLLGLLWNTGSLAALALSPDLGRPATAVAYAALGFLPAVVVHSVLRGDDDRGHAWSRRLVWLAYGLSGLGAALQVATLFRGAGATAGLRLLTAAFLALAVPLLLATRRQGYARRSAWLAALATFAISGFHLSHAHLGETPWAMELIGHHASLPLAFAILFFDYRFALADLFLKRAASFLAFAALGGAALYGVPAALGLRDLGDPITLGVLILVALGLAAVFPPLSARIHRLVDRTVLQRADYGLLAREITALASGVDEVPVLLDRVVARLLSANVASEISWAEREVGPGEEGGWIPIPTTEPPRLALRVGPLHRGRRLLSEEIALLSSVAQTLARRVDSIRLLRERVEQGRREQEMSRLATEAELRALRAQINPHFLFNALNTVGYLVRTAPEKAYETLLLLTSLLRTVLRPTPPLVPLRDELRIVESYLEIEKTRFEERLSVRFEVDEAVRDVEVPAFLLQPLVENAVKHGIAPLRAGGEVVIEAARSEPDAIVLRVRDRGAATATEEPRPRVPGGAAGGAPTTKNGTATGNALSRGRREGVGLANLEKRLEALYAGRATLTLESAPSAGTTVTIRLPAGTVVRPAPPPNAGAAGR